MHYYNKVEVTGVNTYDLPVLSNKRMRELFEQMARGEGGARDELVRCNLKLVLSVLKRFKNRGENMDDLFQIGCIGLMKAIDNFRLEHNVNFSTYAVPMILGEIKRFLRDNNYVHMSRSIKISAQKLQEERDRFLQQEQREPSIKELASRMEMSPEEVIMVASANTDPLSIFEPLFNDGSEPLQVMDLLKDTGEGDEHWLELICLRESLDCLDGRERYVISARYFNGKTQVAIAKRLGLSQAQVSRIEKNALQNLRQFYMAREAGGNQSTELHEPQTRFPEQKERKV